MTKKVKITKDSEVMELEQHEFEALLQAIEDFDEQSLVELCGSDNYQIIPDEDEDGNILTVEQVKMAVQQVKALGFKVIYRVENKSNHFYIEPKTCKTLHESENIH